MGRIMRSMRRLIAALQAALVLAGLLLLAMPVGLACCAGLIDAHGGDCCEAAMTDAMARSCCEGGESALAKRPNHQAPPPAPALAALPVAPWSGSLALPLEAVGTQRPPDGGLFTLHSVLLL